MITGKKYALLFVVCVFSVFFSCGISQASISNDTTFGGGQGYVSYDLPANGLTDFGKSVVVAQDGRIIITGHAETSVNNPDMGLWVLNSDGSPDTSFAGTGYVTHHSAAGGISSDEGAHVMLDSSGRIVVIGFSRGTQEDMAVWRYNPNGTLDTTFNGKGFFTHNNAAGGNGADFGWSGTFDDAGNIIVAGESAGPWGSTDMTVWRITTDGTLDTIFNGTGFLTYDEAGAGDAAFDVKIDSSGRIVVAGFVGISGPTAKFTLWRFNDNGTLDTSFGTNGIAITPYLYRLGYSHTVQIKLLDTGKMLVTVMRDIGNRTWMSEIIRLNEDGSLDTTFGPTNTGVTEDILGILWEIDTDGQGRILVGGKNASFGTPGNLTLWRYTADGLPDTTFNGGQGYTVPGWLTDFDIDQQGRIVVTGGKNSGVAAWRFLTDEVPTGPDIQTGTSLDVGSTVVNSTLEGTVTVHNYGVANLTMGTVASVDGLATPFSITADGCSSQVLAPNDSCDITVQFAPVSAGTFDDTFDIPSDDPDEPSVTVSVSGTGTALPEPDITVTDSVTPNNDLQVAFGNVTEGSSSDQTVTVTNDGAAGLTVGTVAFVDGLSAPFSITSDGCSGQTLIPTGSCSLTVQFAPTATGSFYDTFDIPSDDPDEPSVTVSIMGTGDPLLIPDIRVEDSIVPVDDHQMDFGSLDVGLTSNVETIDIYNDGIADLNISDVQLMGTNATDFIVDITTPVSCGPAYMLSSGIAPCSIGVSFAPQSEGVKSATVRITSDDPDEPTLDVALTGTGLSSVVNDPPSAPVLLYPADGQQGLDPGQITMTWQPSTDPEGGTVTYELYVTTDPSFTGTDPVIVGAASLGAAFACLGLLGLVFGMAGTGTSRRRMILALAVAVLFAALTLLAACGATGTSSSHKAAKNISHTETNLGSGTTYYWKVAAKDDAGNSSESEVRSFATR